MYFVVKRNEWPTVENFFSLKFCLKVVYFKTIHNTYN